MFSKKRLPSIHRRRAIIKKKTRRLSRAHTKQSRLSPRGRFLVSYALLLVLFSGMIVYTLLFSPFLEIRSITIEGTNTISTESAAEKIEVYMKSKLLETLPHDNLLVFSSRALTSILSAAYPKIRSVSVEKTFPGSVRIRVEEYPALVALCSGGPCFFIDENGVAYRGADASFASTIFVIDEKSDPIAVGEKALSSEATVFFSRSGVLFEEITGAFPLAVKISSRASQEAEFLSSEGWRVLAGVSEDPEESWRLLATFSDQVLPRERWRDELEYADIRVARKIFYQVKNSE